MTIRQLMDRGSPPITNLDIARTLTAARGKTLTKGAVSLMVHGHRGWRPSYIKPLLKLFKSRHVSVTLEQLVGLCGKRQKPEATTKGKEATA